MPMGRKTKVFFLVFALLLIAGAVQGATYFWYHGYAEGTKTGTIRKLALTGPPYCKVMLGEIALVGAAPGTPAEIWTFTVDDANETDTVMKQLRTAEREAKPTTLRYRQDKNMWWRCAPVDYYVTGVEK